MDNMTYSGVGVDYEAMDPFKRACQVAGRETAGNINRLNRGEFQEFEASRGESVYLIEAAKSYFAHVEEGLGTKNLVADAMYQLTGKSYYDNIAQDTVAMIVNDMITLGALPLSVAMHLAVGNSDWFDDENRSNDLIKGWKKACDLSRCVWGGGETPTLRDIVMPGTVVLSGSAMGIVKPKERLISADNIQDGDAIILIGSSGIHANGLTMAREIADKLPMNYVEKMSDDRTYGEALLDPTYIYVGLVEDCLDAGVEIHYTVNITGHGWRKLMRSPLPCTYRINNIPEPQPVFKFMQEHGPISDEEAYGNLNMGAGFALYVPQKEVGKVLEIAHRHSIGAMVVGVIEPYRQPGGKGGKRVIIAPLGIEFSGESLQVR